MTVITVMLLAFHSLPVVSYAAEQEETTLSTSTIEESTETTISSSELLTEQSTEKSTESIPEATTESSHVEQPESQAPQEAVSNYQPEEQAAPDVQLPEVAEPLSTKIAPNLTTEEFVKRVGKEAQKVAEENDLFASVMIAQAILESGSGSSELSQAPFYNLFGIKGNFNGQSVTFNTQEDDGSGNLYMIQSSFRKYPSFKESFQDYSELLKRGASWNEAIYQGTWKSVAGTYQNATQSLTGVYASDTQYNIKLNQLIETYDLVKYDFPEVEVTAGEGQFSKPLATEAPITDMFGGEDNHRGVDFAAAEGTPIHAMAAGTVIFAQYHDSWGNYVAIQHSNGITSLYAHQSMIAVNVGDTVIQGQVIGYVGSTGNSTGPHLHVETCLDSSLAPEKLVDPMSVISNG